MTKPSAESMQPGEVPNSMLAGKEGRTLNPPRRFFHGPQRGVRESIPGSRQRKQEPSALHPHSHPSLEEHSGSVDLHQPSWRHEVGRGHET